MALPAPPADQPMAAAGPSGARAGVPVPSGPSPHRVRFGRPAAIEIDSDPEDDYDMDDLMFLPLRRNVKFAPGVDDDDDDDDDDDVQIARFAPVAGPAPKAPQQPDPAAARAGPAPAATATSPFDDAVQAILGILPDISRSHLKTQLLHQPTYGPAEIEAVLEGFLSMPNGYPKEAGEVAKGAAAGGGGGGKGKGRADEHEQARNAEAFMQVANTIDEDHETEKTAQNWLDISKRGANWNSTYWEAAVDQLSHDFPLIRLPDVRKYFSNSSHLYAPTFIALTALMQQPVEQRGIKMLASARSNKGKGRQKQDDNFDREREWVVNGLPKWRALQRRREAQEKRLAEEIKAGAFFECGCCFGETAMSQLVTCSEGCQFCPDCVRGIADNEIGLRKYILKCMATDGCNATFPESELVKCLPRKTLGALHKIKQEKEVDEAEIEGLVKCPFCPFAMIIESPDERLFHCHRPDCRIVSCRDCGKRDHLPKTCAEVTDSELKLKSVHHVEEAMTEALIRRCPKSGCNEPYVKESGTCNKIRCSNCSTLSCYICNKIIEGYQHFKNPGSNLPLGQKVDAKATCALWDDTDSRNFQEVEAARIAAEEEARRLHAEVQLKDDDFAKLKMAKPAAPDPKVAHLPPPQIPAYAALAHNRVAGAAAGPAGPAYGRAVAPPAPAKPAARKQGAAKAAADARVQARLDADAARRRQREDARRREQEELARVQAETAKLRAEIARMRAQLRADAAAEARAAMDARAQLTMAERAPAVRRRIVGAPAGPSGARSPAVNQRDVLNPLPAAGGAQAAKLDSDGAQKRVNDMDAAREAKRARLSGARPAA